VLRTAATRLASLVGDGPAWPLRTWLALGLALRVPAALFADGFDFPDQQFQYVDPAWHLATGAAWHRPWEWIDGVRSHVYPHLLAAILRLPVWLGVDDPRWAMRIVRVVHSLTALLPLWLFWKVVVEWLALPKPRIALTLLAVSGLAVGAHVQPAGPAFAATLATAAAFAVHGPRWYPALGGLCLGLAFCARYQEAVFGPALLAVLLWQRRGRAAALFALGCLPGIVLQGLADLATCGRFLGSAFDYVQTNVGGSAAKWRAQPWWFYLAAGVVPVVVLVPPFLRITVARLRDGARRLPGAFAAAVLHIAVHSFVARKALRFETGALTMLLAVLAVGLATTTVPVRGAGAWHRRVLLLVHGVLFCHASFWFGNAGAVRMACWLREQGANEAAIVVVDGDATTIGGFFYLRPSADRVTTVERAHLAEHLGHGAIAKGTVVVSAREPLDLRSLPTNVTLEALARFDGMLDLRAGERRFVYRVQ